MSDTYDPTYSTQMAEGNAPAHARHIKSMVKDPAPSFMRMIVLEVISDPYIVDDDKISYWRHVLQVVNYQYSNLLPRNAIIAQRLKTSRVPVSQPMFLFPFFPSHLSLPCKPGEMVWAMFEDPNAREKDLGFWFCRVTEPHIGDDVNHSHAGTKLDQTNIQTLVQRSSGSMIKPAYELHNGAATTNKDGIKVVKPGTEFINPPGEYSSVNVFEQLLETTDASKLSQYESVPRFRKRPGDIAIEGSNNSLIVLGTDRPGPLAEYTFLENLQPDERNPGAIPNITGINSTSKITGSAGSIDLVVGRGTLPTTGGTPVSTTTLASVTDSPHEIKKEIAKYPFELVNSNEGDPDLINDRSRILISQRTAVDTNFGTAGYNSQFQISDSTEGDAAITIKTDKVRIIARSDISLVVTNFTYNPTSIDNSTAGYKADNTAEQNKWASITIKTNGDIVFTPSDNGVVKLGGDTADRAILCTARPAINNQGTVNSLPVATTAGGFIGTTGGNFDTDAVLGTAKADLGTFASKILVTAAT